jgi:NitT/TauT family transport system ATP-binding protein
MPIQLVNISKQFNNRMLFDKLNIEIKEQQITCIMGPSGAGKTTLLHIIMGLMKADSGKVKGLEGKKLTAVFQEDRLCENMDAIKNVQLVCDKRVEAGQVIREFEKVDLTDYENKPVTELSGGMRRRVVIVRALMPESDLVIMDEPFKGLDEELKSKVIQYVIQKTKGKTVIIVTHDKEEADELSAEVINL